MNAIDFFLDAKEFCISKGYGEEIRIVRERHFHQINAEYFLHEYVFVVLNAGMRNQVAQSIYDKFIQEYDPDTVGHLGKRKAIKSALLDYRDWFKQLKESSDKLAYLESLPWIGPITKYHLARNVGIDVAKPDRHLKRLAPRLGFKTVQRMCEHISKETGERVGVVDVILWRYCNLTALRNHQLERKRRIRV